MTRAVAAICSILLICLFPWTSAIAGEEKPPASPAPEARAQEPVPVQVEADQIQSKGNDFTFTGNVVVTRGATRLECDHMDGTIEEVEIVDPKTKQKSTHKRIATLVAQGNVKVLDKTSGRRADCDKADYDVKQDKIVMTGTPDKRPRVAEGTTITEADRIILLLKDNRILWENDPGHRTTIIMQGATPGPEKPKEDKKKPE